MNIEKVKDLQDLFEQLGTKDFKWLIESMDKKGLNKHSVDKIGGYIFLVYVGEKGLDGDEINLPQDELEELWSKLSISAAIWESCLRGHMEIKSGRLGLINDTATLGMTKEGIAHVENMILPKLK